MGPIYHVYNSEYSFEKLGGKSHESARQAVRVERELAACRAEKCALPRREAHRVSVFGLFSRRLHRHAGA